MGEGGAACSSFNKTYSLARVEGGGHENAPGSSKTGTYLVGVYAVVSGRAHHAVSPVAERVRPILANLRRAAGAGTIVPRGAVLTNGGVSVAVRPRRTLARLRGCVGALVPGRAGQTELLRRESAVVPVCAGRTLDGTGARIFPLCARRRRCGGRAAGVAGGASGASGCALLRGVVPVQTPGAVSDHAGPVPRHGRTHGAGDRVAAVSGAVVPRAARGALERAIAGGGPLARGTGPVASVVVVVDDHRNLSMGFWCVRVRRGTDVGYISICSHN